MEWPGLWKAEPAAENDVTVVGVSLLVIGALWLFGLVAATQHDLGPTTLEAVARSNETLDVTVIVPARNEAHNTARCLSGLMAQRVREILVVDDRSEDETASIVEELARRDPRIRLVPGHDPPEGWTGKVNALVTGVEAATDSKWLLFVDADVALNAGAIRAAVSRAQADGADVLSLWGRWIMPSLGVRLLQPVIGAIIRATAQIERVNDAGREEAFLNGQFVLVEREAYDRVGGWGAVKDRVLEDVAFARHAKAEGLRLRMLYGRSMMSVVPYRTLADLWNGYRKNVVQGAGGVVPTLVLALVVLVFSVYPFVAAPWLLQHSDVLASWIPAGAVGACLAAVGFRMVTAPLFDHPRIEALLHPVANLLLVGLLLHAVWTALTGGNVPWKGRVYRT